MENEHHREYQQKQKKHKISGSMILVHDHWFWNLIFVFVGILDGFRYPLVLKSWFSCFVWYSRWFSLPIGSEIVFFVFSMVLLPIGSEILVFLLLFVFSMVFAIPYIISAVRVLRFPRGCLTECSLHDHGMSYGMLPGCLAGCQDSMNPPCITTLAIEGIPYYRKAKPFTIGGNPLL